MRKAMLRQSLGLRRQCQKHSAAWLAAQRTTVCPCDVEREMARLARGSAS